MLPTRTREMSSATRPWAMPRSIAKKSFRFWVVPPTAPIEAMLPRARR